MLKEDKIALAAENFNKAMEHQFKGEIKRAIKYYSNSIEIFPTAVSHVYLGAAYSLQGNYEKAIRECEIALSIDPKLSIALNNIGNYLINLGKNKEAIPWFEKVIKSENFEMKYQSCYNLGKIYENMWELVPAIYYYKLALNYFPEYEQAQNSLLKLMALLN